MIKGVNRQVVEVSDTGSEYFERILFIVKPEYATVSEGKVRERVEQIAQATGAPPPTKAKRRPLLSAAKLTAAAMLTLLIVTHPSLPNHRQVQPCFKRSMISSRISEGTNVEISPPNIQTCLTTLELKNIFSALVVIKIVSTSGLRRLFVSACWNSYS